MAGIWSFPNLIWNVKNPFTVSKQQSPVFILFDAKWNLEYVYGNGVRGETLQLFLGRITPCSIPQVQLEVETTICTKHDSYRHLPKNVEFDFTVSNEVCIWDETSKVVQTNFKCRPDIYFNCLFRPSLPLKKFLDRCESAEISNLPYLPCIESLRHDFTKMFNNEEQSDVILNCSDRKIFAHRAILSARSEVFAAMFRTDMKESKEQFVNIIDMEPRVLEHLIRYIYTGEISDLSVENVQELYTAADIYAVGALKMKCGNFMVENWEALAANIKDKVVDREDNDCNVKENAFSYFPQIKSVVLSKEWERFSIEHPELAIKALDVFLKNSF